MKIHSPMPIMLNSAPVAFVPWDIFTMFDDNWAHQNHNQSLEKLASRGGLSVAELVAILDHRPYRDMELAEAWERLWHIISLRTATRQIGVL